ncbi:MAG: DUF4860 domain-containing protein [Eubacteriales bacterium]|jgi:hypothetical protein
MRRFGGKVKKGASLAQIIFPIVLFAFFATAAILVILFGARVYQSTVEKSGDNYNARTLLSYVTQKIRQNDEAGSVSVEDFDGTDALVLRNDDGSDAYRTLIYLYNGQVCELTVLDDTTAELSAGTGIIGAQQFEPEETGDGIFHFMCVDAGGKKAETVVAVRSAGSADEEASS